jgi:hypothetical protein
MLNRLAPMLAAWMRIVSGWCQFLQAMGIAFAGRNGVAAARVTELLT